MNKPLTQFQFQVSEKEYRKYPDIKKTTRYVAIGMMIVAYFLGSFLNNNEMTELIAEKLPGMSVEKIKSDPDVYQVLNKATNTLDSWLLVTRQQGWGGPMQIGTLIDEQAKLKSVLVLNHKETPSFFKALIDQGFFKQFQNKPIQDNFQIGEDIDAITGATISSRAITDAVSKKSHYWGREYFELDIAKHAVDWQVGQNEFILVVYFSIIIISAIKKYRKVRYGTLVFGIVFLGFYLSVPISISAFASLMMGYIPEISSHLFWWLLVVGVVLMTLILGRNLYCSWACPFGGIQEFLTIIGGVKTKVNPRLNQMASTLVFSLFWLSFMIMFLTSNPGLGTFEPFAVLFSFKGMDVQWYLVSIAILGSFMIPRFWCRFFCPVGLVLKKLARIKQHVTAIYRKKLSQST